MDLDAAGRSAEPRLGEGGRAPVRPLPARGLAARAGDEVDRRGDGRRRRLPGGVRQGPGRRRARCCRRRERCSSRSPTATSRPPPSSPPSLHDLGFKVLATGGTAQAIRRMGVPVERIQKLSEGSPNVVERIEAGEVDLVDQHADRLGRARRRLRDPPRGRGARDPLHHDDDRRQRGAARDPRAPPRRAGRRSRSRSCTPDGAAAGAAAPVARRARRERPPPSRGRSRRPSAASPRSRAVERVGAYDLITRPRRRRARRPAAGPVLHARRRRALGRGSGERPYLPRAFSFARAQPASPAASSCSSCSRTSARARTGSASSRPGEGLALLGPLGRGFDQPAGDAGALLVGGGIGAAPLLCWTTSCAPRTRAGARCSASARRPTPRPPRCSAGGRGRDDRRRIGRARRRSSPSRCASCSTPTPRATVYACGPPAMLEAVRGALRRARGAGAAGARVRAWRAATAPASAASSRRVDGYVRLCVDGPVLDAAGLAEVWHP